VIRKVLTALAALSVIGAAPAPAKADTLEYAVKAAYLFKFTPFVEWPSSAFAAPSSPFYVCVFGSDPFGPTLDQALNGHQVGEHPVKVRRLLADLVGVSDCHILYIGASPVALATAAVDKLRGTPVLTVTEQGLGVSGGIVQFVIKDGHVRFTIDAAAAAANRMMISAKLLSLAASVRAGS
jgi:hypothetical protein